MRKFLGKIHRSETNRGMFTRFAGVGATISLVDVGLLYLLNHLGMNIYLARIPSFLAAMSLGYILNRYFTFHHLETGRALWHSLVRHYSVHGVGGAINYAVFSATLIPRPAAGRSSQRQRNTAPSSQSGSADWSGSALIFSFPKRWSSTT